MTGGFNATVRGIEIDVTETLNHFLKQNKNKYTLEEFENYLTKIGLVQEYSDKTDKFATALDVEISNFSLYFLFCPNSSALA